MQTVIDRTALVSFGHPNSDRDKIPNLHCLDRTTIGISCQIVIQSEDQIPRNGLFGQYSPYSVNKERSTVAIRRGSR